MVSDDSDIVKSTSVPGDGACLFHRFKVVLEKISSKSINARTLLAEVVSHSSRHRQHYEKQWNGSAPDDSKCSSCDTYIELIAKDDAYASDLEVAALGRLTSR